LIAVTAGPLNRSNRFNGLFAVRW